MPYTPSLQAATPSAGLFRHTTEPLARQHAPSGYTSYKGYKEWLRDEFRFECAYCLLREAFFPNRDDAFSVEHVSPKSLDSAGENDYRNLLYVCLTCNSHKGTKATLNLEVEPIGKHVRLDDDGSYVPLTPEGGTYIDLFALNVEPRPQDRRKYLRIAKAGEKPNCPPDVRDLYADVFAFPHNMPSLEELRPPGGNANAGSESESYYARNRRGELPAVY